MTEQHLRLDVPPGSFLGDPINVGPDAAALLGERDAALTENAGLREALEAARVERDEARRVIRNAHAAIRQHTTAAAVALAMFDTRDNAGPSLLDELTEVRTERDAMRPVVEAARAYEEAWDRYANPSKYPGLNEEVLWRLDKANAHQALLNAVRPYTQSSNPGEKS